MKLQQKNDKKGLGDRALKWSFHREFPHTETIWEAVETGLAG
jgi:hypothetical protein